MSLGYGSAQIGFDMAELNAALTANIDRALKNLFEGRDPASVSNAEIAAALDLAIPAKPTWPLCVRLGETDF